ncbi:TetR/AcrR family transcriptional regulator [Novosphingobium tardum]|uniref:TetR/AcrR family transcriptional regulator n=1 Tax=Novosphingobium tardum TaxID=1538021 RepID=A0ABV8RPT7_9SPHN
MAASPAKVDLKPRAASAPSRLQAERSAATRRKLVCATIATLNSLGYTATTTIEVVRRARVSRGAMLHHFKTRADLLLATAEHILDEQERDRREVLSTVDRGRERFFAITDAMWNTMRQPEAVALTEIMLGARSDPEIHGPFALLMRGYNQKLLDGPSVVAEDLGYSNTRAVRAMARLHVAAMRGLMVDQLYWDENDTGIDDAFELLVWYKRLIMRFLEEPAFKDVVHDLPRPLKRQGSVGKDPTSQND